MARLIILGSAYAIPNEKQENTHMAVVGEHGTILIDTSGTPIVRLKQAGIELDDITDLILTHFHPDHVSGMPPLLMGMWLLGRKKPLHIHGLRSTMAKAETMMSLYDWQNWPNFFQVQFHPVEDAERQPLLENQDMKIISSPVRHMVPTIGLRIEIKSSRKTIVYSCDTEPFDGVVTLAEGADLLIHEAAGKGLGHSSPAQAGEIAKRAEVGALLLIHYAPVTSDTQVIAEAHTSFQGDIKLAKDWMTLEF